MENWFVFLMTSIRERGSEKHKAKFINYLINEFGNKGFECITDKRNHMFNLIIGNMHKAKKIYIVGYDTPSIYIGSNYIYRPLNTKRNNKTEQTQIIIKFALFILSILVCCLFLVFFWNYDWKIRLAVIASSVIIIKFTSRLTTGIWNKNNANKNTASLAVCLKLLEDSIDNKDDIAVMFMDNTATSYLGYIRAKEIIEKYKQKATVYILECLASGRELYAITKKKNINLLKSNIQNDKYKINEYYLEDYSIENSFISLFDKAILFVSGEIIDKDICVVGSRAKKDKDADIERLEYVKNILISRI